MMFDPGGLLSGIRTLIKAIFGDQAPSWIIPLAAWVLVGGLLLCGVCGLLLIVSKIGELWKLNIVPLFYPPEQQRRRRRRQRLAEHIEGEMARLARLESWHDDRYTELEAEVEADGRRRARFPLPFIKRTRSGLRRERNLSRALAASREPIILVEGEPGSGKSIALRHVAQKLARGAKSARSLRALIPVYVNLRQFDRQHYRQLTIDNIRAYIRDYTTRVNDKVIEDIFDEEFNQSVADGTFLFLFDSFDEIPDILASVEGDATIQSYAEALADFIQVSSPCKAVIASRYFRGPSHTGWPRFKLQPLTAEQQRKFAGKWEFPAEEEQVVVELISAERYNLSPNAPNPLFLSLICAYVADTKQAPENTHNLFENFIGRRLNEDEERVRKRYGVSAGEVRRAAELVAMRMSVDQNLGLSPERDTLLASVTRDGGDLPQMLPSCLEALEYMRLARAEAAIGDVHRPTFAFAHRRFQEYFATCVVLRHPDYVGPIDLLCGGMWRETAVTLLQTQRAEDIGDVLGAAAILLDGFCSAVGDVIDDPITTLRADHRQQAQITGRESYFPWPARSLHVLGLLQEGAARRLDLLSDGTRMAVARLVVTAWKRGNAVDAKWALEHAGTVPDACLEALLRAAFASDSQWLREVAYRQVARLQHVSKTLASGIRSALIRLAVEGVLRRERSATRVYLARLRSSEQFEPVYRTLLYLPRVDAALYLVLIVGAGVLAESGGSGVGVAHQIGLAGLDHLLWFLLFLACLSLAFAVRRYVDAVELTYDQEMLAFYRVCLSLGRMVLAVCAVCFLCLSLGQNVFRDVTLLPATLRGITRFSLDGGYLLITVATWAGLYRSAAYWACSQGRFCSWKSWIALPLLFAAFEMGNVGLIVGVFIAASVVSIGLPLLAFNLLSRLLGPNVGLITGILILIAVFIPASLETVRWAVEGVVSLANTWRHHQAFRSACARLHPGLTITELSAELDQLQRPVHVVRLLERVRVERMMEPGEATGRGLMVMVGRASTERIAAERSPAAQSRTTWQGNSEAIDQLSRLAEQFWREHADVGAG
jgi:hypothetical protein